MRGRERRVCVRGREALAQHYLFRDNDSFQVLTCHSLPVINFWHVPGRVGVLVKSGSMVGAGLEGRRACSCDVIFFVPLFSSSGVGCNFMGVRDGVRGMRWRVCEKGE